MAAQTPLASRRKAPPATRRRVSSRSALASFAHTVSPRLRPVLREAEAMGLRGDTRPALDLLIESSDDVEALNFVGYLLADHGIRLDEAERLLVRAAELAPTEGAVLDSLGWLWFRKGDAVRAIHTLERADALADGTVFVAGGGEIYRAAWDRLTGLEITEVDVEVAGDVVFPSIDPRDWVETAREDHSGYRHVSYRRRSA